MGANGNHGGQMARRRCRGLLGRSDTSTTRTSGRGRRAAFNVVGRTPHARNTSSTSRITGHVNETLNRPGRVYGTSQLYPMRGFQEGALNAICSNVPMRLGSSVNPCRVGSRVLGRIDRNRGRLAYLLFRCRARVHLRVLNANMQWDWLSP